MIYANLFPTLMFLFVVLLSSVSGYVNFEKARAAGADITLADSRCDGLMPKLMYAAITEPAIVAKPPVITACNSDLVIFGRNGLIISGASVLEWEKWSELVTHHSNHLPFPKRHYQKRWVTHRQSCRSCSAKTSQLWPPILALLHRSRAQIWRNWRIWRLASPEEVFQWIMMWN